jgi:hypothetical protein
MRNGVTEILEELAKEHPCETIEGKELGELYARFNEAAEKIRLNYARKEAESEIAAGKSYITC